MKFDLHVHSEHSQDSRSSVKDILKMAKKRSLHGLAFLDHNTMDAYWQAEGSDLIIVPGVEVSTPQGHVGALGVEESIRKQPDVKTAVERIYDMGGTPIALHPYRFWSGIGEEEVRAHRWGAVEGMNARTSSRDNLRAQRLAKQIDLPIIGGSDAHNLEQVGMGYTIVKKVNSWQGLLEEIRCGRTEVGGIHRSKSDTFRYVKKAVSEWMSRGFSRM